MLIGQVALMIEGQLVAMSCSWEAIESHGVHVDNLQYQDPAQKLSIKR
jgi:hypothetical protein